MSFEPRTLQAAIWGIDRINTNPVAGASAINTPETRLEVARRDVEAAAKKFGDMHIEWATARQELRDAHKRYAKLLAEEHER